MDQNFIDKLSEESSSWEKEGLISEEQRHRILSRYSSTAQIPPQRKRLTATIATLGALLVGVGVILFFASNWDKIAPFTKMSLLLTALVTSYGLGYRLFDGATPSPRMGRSFWFLGAILYGANIFLVAQAYNINSHWPNGVLWWALGVLPMALILSSRAMTVMVVAGLSFWMGSELSLAVGHRSSVELMICISFVLWGCGAMGLSRILSSFARTQAIAPVFRWFGLLFILAGSFPFTFKAGPIHAGGSLFSRAIDGRSMLLAYTIGASLVLLGSIGGSWWRRSPQNAWKMDAWLLAAGAWGWFLALGPAPGSAPMALLGNVVFFFAVISILYVGYLSSLESCVNLGLLAFAAQVIGRYFDFAWKYMERSAAFIVGGLLLLLMGFALERGRRRLLDRQAKT